MRLRQISEERESLVNGEIASPVSLVKRRFSMIAVMLISALYIADYAFIYFKFSILNLNIFLSIAVIITLVITLILWNLIKTKGIEIFRKL